MLFFTFPIFRNKSLLSLRYKKNHFEPIVRTKRLFFENFRKKKPKIIKNEKVKFIKDGKKSKLIKTHTLSPLFDTREVILKILIVLDNFTKVLGGQKKEAPVETQIILGSNEISFKIYGLNFTSFDLKKTIKTILRPKIFPLFNVLHFKEKIKIKKKKMFFFRSNSILKDVQEIQIITNFSKTPENYKIQLKNFENKKISRIPCYTGNYPHISINLFFGVDFFNLQDKETLVDFTKEFFLSFSTKIFFFEPQTNLIVSSLSEGKKLYKDKILDNFIWKCSPQLVLKREYFSFFQTFGDNWEYPLAVIHVNYTEKDLINFCLFIPRENLPRSKKKINLGEKPRVFLHSNEKFFPDPSNFLNRVGLDFIRGVIESEGNFFNSNTSMSFSGSPPEELKKSLIKKARGLFLFVAENDSLTYAYLWKNFGYSIKTTLLQNENSIRDLAPLLRFYSNYSRILPISISDYVKRMKNNQNIIYYFRTKKIEGLKNNGSIERIERENFEVLLIENEAEEVILKLLEKGQRNVKRKKIKFENIMDFDTISRLEGRRKNFENEKLREVEDWYSDILRKKVLKVVSSEKLEENSTSLIQTKMNKKLPRERISVFSLDHPRKNLFMAQNLLKIYEVSSSNPITKLLNFFILSKRTSKYLEQIGTLMWEITHLDYDLELPSQMIFKRRFEMVLVLFLIYQLSFKNKKRF